MVTLGRACLILALAIAAYGIGASIYGARAGRRDWIASGRRAVYTLAGVLTVAFVLLEIAFVRSDFSFALVATHSSTSTPFFYRLAAMWSSQEGSLLLWVWLLSVWSSVALRLTRHRLRDVAPYATAALLAFAAFFAGLLVFLANPFALLSPVPLEGTGLNPLLRHPSMVIHPPMLYTGYTLFSIPFAFALGALVTRRLGADWIAATRRFTLAAWLCLGIGIMLGARWSYTELGWGGYWSWDPVENASLLPWLTGTALLHSAMIQEKRGMLKVWNVSLVLATGILAVLGTFLVRSGILKSIHAFGASTLGTPFLVFIALLIAVSVWLVVSRAPQLRSEHRLDSLLSREAAFLFNNLVLVAMAFVVFWGTFFPLISEAITGRETSVGGPWFDRFIVPLAIGLVLLSGIGPAIAWRRATVANVRRNFALPVGGTLAAGVVLIVAGVGSRPAALALFCAAAFAFVAIGQELWRGTRARRAMRREPVPRAVIALVRRNRRRYGGYVVHIGIAVLFVGVAASSAFQRSRDVVLRPGQSARVGGYDVRWAKPVVLTDREKVRFGADMVVSKDGRTVARLRPTRALFPTPVDEDPRVLRFFNRGDPTSEVGLDPGPTRDIWISIEPVLSNLNPFLQLANRIAPDISALPIAKQLAIRDRIAREWVKNPPPANFRILVSPLVGWIWAGGLIVALGALIAIWPPPRARREAPAGVAPRVAPEPVAGELTRA